MIVFGSAIDQPDRPRFALDVLYADQVQSSIVIHVVNRLHANIGGRLTAVNP